MKLLSQDNRRKLLSWLAGCRTNFELGLLLSLSTGIRVGELCGVKWEDVDLEEESCISGAPFHVSGIRIKRTRQPRPFYI